MTLEEIKDFLRKHPGYSKEGSNRLSRKLNADEDLCYQALGEIRKEFKSKYEKNNPYLNIKNSNISNKPKTSQDIFKNVFTTGLYAEDVLNAKKHKYVPYKLEVKKNVLVVGDLHLPFTLKGYLEHCIKVYKKYNCDTVVFIGDILDLHFTSYHETSTEGYGATQEHDLSVEMLRKWYKAFPKAYVTIGNHDALIYRKAMSAGISKRWIQNYSQVLGTPGWEWVTDVVIDDVLYTHGTTNAYTKSKQNLMSTVQGHLHSQAGIQFYVGAKSRIFGFQIGCGVDMKSYAMEYGRNFPKPVISCGVVIEGLHPYLEVMDL
jgi:metallophosphoesterase superfamily enzyme